METDVLSGHTFCPISLATPSYAGLAYVGSDSVVRDSVHGRVRMDPLAGSVFREGLVMVPCIIDRVSFSSM